MIMCSSHSHPFVSKEFTTEHKEEGELRNLDNIFVNDGSNNNFSWSLSITISSSNDSSTITTDHQKTGVHRKVPCPICGHLFPIIASHADLCVGKHQNEMLREIHCDKDSGNIDKKMTVKLSL